MSTTQNHETSIERQSGPSTDLGCEPLLAPITRLEDLEPIHREIYQCVYCGNEVRTFSLMSWLMHSTNPLPIETHHLFIDAFRSSVGDLALPLISDTVIEHRYILDQMLERQELRQDTSLLRKAKNVAYRVYEACGDHRRARKMLLDLVNGAADASEGERCAHFTNNYGYEFLLEGDYSSALAQFQKALEQYRALDSRHKIANVEANVLTCEFALLPSNEWESLLPRLRESHRIFHATGDWRIRKTMRLLAMRAEARGHHAVATAWARRAVAQTRGMATGLQREDQAFLDSLRSRSLPKTSLDRNPSSRASGGIVSTCFDETSHREYT